MPIYWEETDRFLITDCSGEELEVIEKTETIVNKARREFVMREGVKQYWTSDGKPLKVQEDGSFVLINCDMSEDNRFWKFVEV